MALCYELNEVVTDRQKDIYLQILQPFKGEAEGVGTFNLPSAYEIIEWGLRDWKPIELLCFLCP